MPIDEMRAKMEEWSVKRAEIVQIIPAPAGCVIRKEGWDEYDSPRAYALALVEITFATDHVEWTGRQILPVDSEGHVLGLPNDADLAAHAFGDMVHGYWLKIDPELVY